MAAAAVLAAVALAGCQATHRRPSSTTPKGLTEHLLIWRLLTTTAATRFTDAMLGEHAPRMTT